MCYKEPVLLEIKPVAMRAHLTQKELALPVLAPSVVTPPHELRLKPAVREHLPGGRLALCAGARQIHLEGTDYFAQLDLILLEHLIELHKRGESEPEGTFDVLLNAVSEERS